MNAPSTSIPPSKLAKPDASKVLTLVAPALNVLDNVVAPVTPKVVPTVAAPLIVTSPVNVEVLVTLNVPPILAFPDVDEAPVTVNVEPSNVKLAESSTSPDPPAINTRLFVKSETFKLPNLAAPTAPLITSDVLVASGMNTNSEELSS